jgi:uncharacterized SAM-binding protein YcdF (DUF218 family)
VYTSLDPLLRDYIVIFGAALRPGGTPSNALRRRVEGAYRLGRTLRDPIYLPTGGVGRFPPAEALVMHDLLLGLGARPEQIILEDAAHDTLSSAVNCAAILRMRGDVGRVFACSSRWHIPRCRMLLRAVGIAAEAAPMPPELPILGISSWLWYCMREAAAFPYDAIAIRWHRRAIDPDG